MILIAGVQYFTEMRILSAIKAGIKWSLQWIDQYDWLILLLFLPVFLFLSHEQSWFLLLIPLLWLINFFAGRKVLVVTPLNGILLLFAVQILISLYATYDMAVSFTKIAVLVYSLALFFALVKFTRKKKAIFISTLLFSLAGLGIAILSFFGTNWATSKISTFNPIYEVMPKLGNLLPGLDAGFHPNEVAGALVWILPIWLIISGWLLIRPKTIRSQANIWLHLFLVLIAISATGVVFVVTFLTQSRSAYLGVILSLIAMLFFVFQKKWRWIFLTAILVSSGLVWYFNGIPLLLNWLGNQFPETTLSVNAFSFDTLNGRIKIWSRALIAIQDFSFTGMGMNTFRYLVHRLYPLAPLVEGVTPRDLGHAHNEVLQSALDLGIPGMIAFIALNMTAFWMSITTILTLQKPRHRPLPADEKFRRELFLIISIGLLGGLLGHFIYGITDAISLGAKPGFLFWMVLGLITGIYSRSARRDFT